MNRDITYYATPVKSIFTYCGMASNYAGRNNLGMERDGLKRARKRLGVGQAVIASRMEVSIPQISRWENGVDGIPSQRLSSLLAAYEGSLEELLGEEPLEDDPDETGPSDEITISLANLAVFVRHALNGGQEGPYSQDDALEIVHGLRSAIGVARNKPGTLDDPARWATFLHGYAAGKPFGLHGS